MSEPVSKAEFARMVGRDRSWVTRLAQAGRLKLTPDGKVYVDESKALIEQTGGNRDDVSRRHDEQRGAGRAPGLSAPSFGSSSRLEKAREVKIVSEARRSAAAADREEMERDKVAGQLLAREDVDAAFKFLGATVRGLLDVMPDQLAPVIAPVTDLETVHALLSDAGRDLLVRLGETVEAQRAALGRS